MLSMASPACPASHHTHVAIVAFAAALFSACGMPKSHASPPPADSPNPTALTSTQTAPANDSAAGFRGYAVTNQLINARFFKQPDAAKLRLYLEDVDNSDIFSRFAPSLTDLLGEYAGDGIHTEIKNADPNGVNMLLWYLALDGFAKELASSCGTPAEHPTFALEDLRPEVQDAIKELCAFKGADVRSSEQLRAIWDIGMQSDAPETEYQSWKSYAQGPSFTDSSAAAVRTLLTTMLYNPHFLLSK